MQVPVQMYTDALTQPIIAPVQETLTAKQAYGAGDFFIYRSKLYKAKSGISQGGSIILEGANANTEDGGSVMGHYNVGDTCILEPKAIAPYADFYSGFGNTLGSGNDYYLCFTLDKPISKLVSNVLISVYDDTKNIYIRGHQDYEMKQLRYFDISVYSFTFNQITLKFALNDGSTKAIPSNCAITAAVGSPLIFTFT